MTTKDVVLVGSARYVLGKQPWLVNLSKEKHIDLDSPAYLTSEVRYIKSHDTLSR